MVNRMVRPMKTVGMNTHIGILSRPPTAAMTSSGGIPTDAAMNMMPAAYQGRPCIRGPTSGTRP